MECNNNITTAATHPFCLEKRMYNFLTDNNKKY